MTIPSVRPMDPARLASLTRAYHGDAFTHVPTDGAPDVRALADEGSPRDRWSVPGPRTVYLGADPSVSLAELARHWEAGTTTARRLLRLRVHAEGLIDLRDAETLEALGVRGAPVAFLHRPFARRLGVALRESGLCRGLLAPSMAFLDEPERHSIVLFEEAFPGGLSAIVTGAAVVGRVGILA